MTRTEQGTYNLIAAFVDFPAAQRALEQLKREQINQDDISLLGRHGDEMVTADRNTGDREGIAAAVKGTIAGAVSGGVLAGLGGVLAGLTVLPIPGVGPLISAGIWAAAGVTVGAEGGGFIGAITASELSKDRSAAYDTYLTRGHVVLGVHSDDASEIQHAEEVLLREQPLAVDRFGSGFRSAAS
jgi:hypothetical protein